MTTIWNPALMSKYGGVAEYGYAGTELHSYQCASCYQASLTAAAPLMPMSMPPKTEPAPGTKCACGAVIRSLVEV
jgi:hypothetical protein